MNLAKKLWMTTGESSGGGLVPSGGYVDDVFSTYVYKGNGTNRSFVTGQNLLADGGVVWTKGRSGTYGATDHYLFHTERGSDIFLSTNTANGQGAFTAGTSVSSFNNDGFSIGTSPYVNDSTTEYVSWVFKNAPKFYGHQVVTKSAGSNASVSFPELVTLGMVRVKRTDQPGGWYVWHRSLPAGQLLIGETNFPGALLGHVTVSGTNVTLVNGGIANGTYLVEAWAHDEALDGIVQCGGYPGIGSTLDINLGWEPQFVLLRKTNSIGDFIIVDDMRGYGVIDANTNALRPNISNVELVSDYVAKTSTGLQLKSTSAFNTYPDIFIYIAIRRPNKPPTSGTQVYNAIARTGTGAAATITGVGFAPDLVISRTRENYTGGTFFDRLRGAGRKLLSTSNDAEYGYDALSLVGFDVADGFRVGGGGGSVNNSSYTYSPWNFRRAPGFMDVVCYTGTGFARTVPHSLGVVPELMIVKARSTTGGWTVYSITTGPTQNLWLHRGDMAAVSGNLHWNSIAPTSSIFNIGSSPVVNQTSQTYVAYLFASLPGISKVGSYSGNGGTQTIPCGFTTGSRFILIRCIDNNGDWFVWDTARGITPTTDPHLSLNTTAAEVTTDDSIDQAASGFVVNQNAATNINALGWNYLFLAIA